MSFQIFKALLKKNLLILKRTYILTLIELFSPMIVILILLLTNSKFETEHNIITFEDYQKNCSAFSKNDDFCKFKGFTYRCPSYSIIALIGKNFPKEIEEKILEYDFEKKAPIPEIIYYRKLSNVIDYIKSKKYKKYKPICFGISYKKTKNKYTFKLHYFASQYIKDRSHANIPSSNIDNIDPFRVKPDFDSYYLYIRSGYLEAEKILYDYVLQKETGNSDAEINFYIIPQISRKII